MTGRDWIGLERIGYLGMCFLPAILKGMDVIGVALTRSEQKGEDLTGSDRRGTEAIGMNVKIWDWSKAGWDRKAKGRSGTDWNGA